MTFRPLLPLRTALPFLLLAPLRAQEPDPMARALARIEATGRPGLCFVVPQDRDALLHDAAAVAALRADFQERLRRLGPVPWLSPAAVERATPMGSVQDRFTTLLHRLLLTADPRAQLLLLEPVLLVAAPERVGARPGENLLLLDARGRRVAGTGVELADDASFVRGADALLQAAREPRPDPAADEVLAQAGAADPDVRRAAAIRICEAPDRYLGRLQRGLATAGEEERERLAETIGQLVRGMTGNDRSGLLPFGVEWHDDGADDDPCPACGMAIMTATARRMLRFAAQ